MLELIKTIVGFFYRRLSSCNDGGLSMLLNWLMSNWVFIPFWLYACALVEQAPTFSVGELFLGMPIISLILFPIGAIQYTLYSLALSTFNRLLDKPRIIAD